MKINLHQSNAGIGNRLKTQRFIDIIAHNINRKVIHADRELLTKSTIQIGQLTSEIASVLSSAVLGLNIFLIRIHNHLNVNRD
ncbi:MAG: hypothetical protein Q8S84_05770 [bacterium]|nr:hypothetical protein [bacterium]MDP3380989.1 hypothetical protein [bacterium]